MTFLFAAGIATVILPIAVGAAVVQRTLVSQHTLIYTLMGLALLALAAFVLVGGRLHLPMPGRRASGSAGPLSVYSLGIFSGAASSCCAPVLAGVLALSGAAGSFAQALELGSAYVLGMVAPLFVLSLLWERFDWRSSRLFRPRTFSWRIGPLRRTVTGSGLASGVLLAVIGGALVVIGVSSDSMPSPSGWQAHFSATLQHYGSEITKALAFVPSWAAAVIAVAVVALLARRALRQLAAADAPQEGEVAGRPVEAVDPKGERDLNSLRSNYVQQEV
jgi:cytochrome c biogenesis protein CcdA